MTTEATERRGGDVSTLALDLYWAAGRTGDVALDAHVTDCARCAAYLAELDALAASGGPSVPVPIPVADVAPSKRAAATRRWIAPAVAAIALAAGLALYVRTKPPADDGYVGLKGTPAVQVLVHRDRDTRIWDGRSPVRPGDALALRVACEGMKRVAVAAPGAAGWARLSDAACEDGDAPLPFTLRVDDAPGDERLAVVLSQSELDDDTLQKSITEGRRAAGVWVVSFVMPKETEKNR